MNVHVLVHDLVFMDVQVLVQTTQSGTATVCRQLVYYKLFVQ